MMRINRMKKVTSKNIFAWMMCFTMVLSVLAIGNVSYATEVIETPATEMTETATSEKTANTDANGMLGKNSDVGIEVTKSITGKAGKSVKVEFDLSSNDETNVKLKSVYPVIDNSFPFETSGDAYKIIKAGDDVEKQKKLSASFKMTARNDIQTGYHSVRFIGEYVKIEKDGTAQDYYVIKTINIYFTGDIPAADFDDNGSNDDASDDFSGAGDDFSDAGDDFSDEGDSGDNGYNGGSDVEAVAPKLIITGYDTVPEKIMAGEKFTITIHIQNTSKTTSVCNGKFLIGNEAGSFIPTSGSSAVFVESIPAGKTGDIKLEMKAGADLQQKNYSLVIKGDFDDGRGNNFTSSDSLTIPVYQEVSFGVAEVSMSPEILGVGSEAALMFTINNKSSVGVYNVNVSAKSDAVEAEESYVGNIAGSSSAYATLNLVGVADNTDSGTIMVVISYEDSEGTVNTYEVPVPCTVSEEGGMIGGEFGADVEYEDDWEEEEEGFNIIPIILAIVGIVVVVAIVTVVIILVIRRKKRMAELLEAEDGEDDLYNENF